MVSLACKRAYFFDRTKHILIAQPDSSTVFSKAHVSCIHSSFTCLCSSYPNDRLRVKIFVSHVMVQFCMITYHLRQVVVLWFNSCCSGSKMLLIIHPRMLNTIHEALIISGGLFLVTDSILMPNFLPVYKYIMDGLVNTTLPSYQNANP